MVILVNDPFAMFLGHAASEFICLSQFIRLRRTYGGPLAGTKPLQVPCHAEQPVLSAVEAQPRHDNPPHHFSAERFRFLLQCLVSF